ncbi:MAG: LexA family transcriptional regulator [Planctomycetes bacterium]|nr:LexA family transcriptional regulator [Planctomycetota bacterium]NUQ36023.1 LexA family transcriptional regulator [Planctomycetaceae bacterium]
MTESEQNVGEKIKRLRSFRGLTCAELADSIGCTRPYLSAVENGRYPASTKILRKLAKALNVNNEYFSMLGEPDIEDTSQYTKENLAQSGQSPAQSANVAAAAGGAVTTRRIPLVALKESGQTTVAFKTFPAASGTEFVDCPTDITDVNAFALSVEGESMAPLIPSGATVIIAPNLAAKERKPAVVRFNNGDIVCRNYQADGGKVILTPFNHNFPVSIHDANDIEWVYPVVKIIIDVYHASEVRSSR